MKFYWVLVFVTILVGVLFLFQVPSLSIPHVQNVQTTLTKPTTVPETVLVTKVIDGDTIQLSTGEKVRYVGMDTPEYQQCFDTEATNRNKELVLGKQVVLEKDVSNTDKYGRLLRYVYVSNIFVNKELVAQGFARVMTIAPDTKYYAVLKKEQDKAKMEKKGLWQTCN